MLSGPTTLAPLRQLPSAVAETLAAEAPEVAAKRTRIRETAEKFEAQLLSQMMQPMFANLSSEAPFGGGAGESTWRGFLVEEMGKQMARSGGVGLAAPVQREMLRMQGLSQ
ncbi:MAG TPA: rod-binding protein [Caulobacteraceae bacterium]|jgi:Rod binding domain-containing protein